MMNITFNRSDGNIGRPLEDKDNISALLFYCNLTSEEQNIKNELTTVQKFSGKDEALSFVDKLSIRSTFLPLVMKHNIRGFYEFNPDAELYVLVADKPKVNLFTEIEILQDKANGDIRQVGVWDFTLDFSTSHKTTINNIQEAANKLERQDTPLSVIYSPWIKDLSKLPDIDVDAKNVSVFIGLDVESPEEQELRKKVSISIPNTEGYVSCTSLGLCLGAISKSKVNECIGWLKKYRTKAFSAGFSTQERFDSLSKSLTKEIDGKKYIYLCSYSGVGGVYISDSHTLGKGDYNTIESVRTMDKAVRNIRARLIMELGSPLYIDAETGRLDPATVKHLEVVAGKELEVMQKAGEISGWSVEIDPNQDVLGTSTVEFVIKKVPVGVFRKGVVNIGYAKKIGG